MRAKILSTDGPKTKRQKRSGFQGRQSGPPQFKNMCGHKRSQGVENNCSRRYKTMGTQWPSGMQNFCRVPAETIETCTIFRPAAKKFADKRPPFWGPETDPKTGAKSSGHKQIKLKLNEWPPFWGPFSGPQNGGRFVGEILVTGQNSKSFDCFCTYATEVFHAAAFPWFCSAAGTCSPHPSSVLAPSSDARGPTSFPSAFLHESRRYVCRFCTSHLVRVKKELLYRLHTNRKKRTPKPPAFLSSSAFLSRSSASR